MLHISRSGEKLPSLESGGGLEERQDVLVCRNRECARGKIESTDGCRRERFESFHEEAIEDVSHRWRLTDDNKGM